MFILYNYKKLSLRIRKYLKNKFLNKKKKTRGYI